MPSISMNNSNFSEEIQKEGTGASSLHPAGEFDARIVAIEYCEMDQMQKQTPNPFLYFHWRTQKGLLKDFCTLSPKAAFQLANRVKAVNATASNTSALYYCGLVGRIAKLVVDHKEVMKRDGSGTFTVAEIKYFNISKAAKQEFIDISNQKYENVSNLYDGYKLKEVESFDDEPVAQNDNSITEDDLPF